MKSFGSQVAAVSGGCQHHIQQHHNLRHTSHVGEFLAAALEIIAILSLDCVLDGAGHWVVCAKNGALNELDLTGHASLEAAPSTAARLLPLSPGLGGARLTPCIW